MALRRRRKASAGFTLPEAVITATVVAILALIVAPLLIHMSRFYIMNAARVELQRDARSSLTIMTRNLRQAQAASIEISRVTVPVPQPYYSRISFTTVDGVPIVYAQQGNRLVETRGGNDNVLADDLRFLNFYFPRSDDMSIVSVSMTLEKGIYEGRKKALHVASEKVRVMD